MALELRCQVPRDGGSDIIQRVVCVLVEEVMADLVVQDTVNAQELTCGRPNGHSSI